MFFFKKIRIRDILELLIMGNILNTLTSCMDLVSLVVTKQLFGTCVQKVQ